MITELTFAREYASFWRMLTPTMDGFVRRLNLSIYERDFSPMKSGVAPSRRAFINQIAFEVFRNFPLPPRNHIDETKIVNGIEEAGEKISSLAMSGRRLIGGNYDLPMAPCENEDAKEQIRRLQSVATHVEPLVMVSPQFIGCGIIDACQGDILTKTTLWEVKAGDRDFRNIDIRQILTYAAINSLSRDHDFIKLGLFNPRIGKSAVIGIDELCYEVGGQSSADLLPKITYSLSSGDISR